MKIDRDSFLGIRESFFENKRAASPESRVPLVRKGLLFIAFFYFAMAGAMTPLHAEESPLSAVLESSKALVDVLSVNVSVVSGTPQGFFDKNTGQILVTRKVAPMSYTRDGSGVVIDPRGIIVTNAHIVRDAGGLLVTFLNGTRAPVKEVCLVAGTDLALLVIDPPFALSSVRLADSDGISVGTNVYTVGHSEWLNGSVIGGRILGVQRGGDGKMPGVTAIMLTFDMAKGDSGCPIFNAKGELLGIVSAGMTGRPPATLAIPSNGIEAAYKEYLRRLNGK